MRPHFILALPLLFASLANAKGKGMGNQDLSTTGAFTLTAYNKSFPAVNNKKLWISPHGDVFLDAGKDNPPSSVELIAFLENTKLRRIVQTGSAPGTEGNLNFGTSNVCCDYAALNFSTSADASVFPTRTTPFYIARPRPHLVFGNKTPFERMPWFACTGSGLISVYYNEPFYTFPDHGASECTVVTLSMHKIKKLPPHDPSPTPPK